MRQNAIIIVNGEKRMAEMFGHSNNFASLSLSQALASNTSIKKRGHPRVNIRLSLQKCKGSQLVFCPHAADGQAARTEQQKFFYFNKIINPLKFIQLWKEKRNSRNLNCGW